MLKRNTLDVLAREPASVILEVLAAASLTADTPPAPALLARVAAIDPAKHADIVASLARGTA